MTSMPHAILVVCAVVYIFCTVEGKVIDLTHILDEKAPRWPTEGVTTKYKKTEIFADYYKDITWMSWNNVEFYEHLGTHIDAPYHFAEAGQKQHEIPIDNLYGPGVIIDVTAKAEENPDYAVSVQDIHDYESTYGHIPPGAVVFMNSGYHKRFPNGEMMMNTKTLEDTSTFHYPGFSGQACDFLLRERSVKAVGVDTINVDASRATEFPCHVNLLGASVILLEFVANLDAAPNNGTMIYLGAIKHRDGTGGPTRVMAIVDDPEMKRQNAGSTCAHAPWTNFLTVLMAVVAVAFYSN